MATKTKKTVGASKEARTLNPIVQLVGSEHSCDLELMIYQANNYMQNIRPRLMADFGVCESSTLKDVNAFDKAMKSGAITLKKGDWICYKAHLRLYPLVKGREKDMDDFEKLVH
jgi:hypothetical protein